MIKTRDWIITLVIGALIGLLLAFAFAGTANTVEVVGAGDIATGGSGDTKTSDLVLALAPNRVLTFGDNAYPDGTAGQFRSYYHPTWGRFKAITEPSPGNHDWHTGGAAGYEGYFGVQAGVARSFVVGDWLLVSMDSEVNISGQANQLAMILANDDHLCEAVYYHHARWSSGQHGSDSSTSSWWNVMYQHGVDLNLVGHDHDYERFRRMNPQGAVDPMGIREVVVGTGGTNTRPFARAPLATTQRRLTGNANWGVLDLELGATRYDAQFRRATGGTGTVADTFGGNCHA